MERLGRFCGECGAPVAKARPESSGGTPTHVMDFASSFQRTQPVMHGHGTPHARPVRPETQPAHHERAPRFAQVSPKITHVSDELRAELRQLLCLLARERIFLLMHWTIFCAMNLFGFWMSMQAYNQFVGDEMTKSVLAMTPLMFINSVALACLVPIKGTKKEIVRIKERLKYVRFLIEYQNLF